MYTDDHDLEVIIFYSKTLESVVTKLATKPKLTAADCSDVDKFRDLIINTLLPLAALK